MPALTIGQLIETYLNHAHRVYRRPDGTPTKTPVNLELALRSLRDHYGSVPVDDLDVVMLRRVRADWVAAGLTRTTCNDRTRVVLGMLEWGVELGFVADATFARCRTVRPLKRGHAPEGRGRTAVDPAIVQRTLPHLPPEVAGMVRFCLLTACRIGEARQARAVDVDLRHALLRPEWHKTARHGCARAIPLTAPALELIRPRMHKPYLFGCGDGEAPYHEAAVTVAIVRGCVRAGVPRWSAGQLRHTAAVQVLKTCGLEHTRAILGHTTDRCTRRYAGRGEGPQLREAANKLELAFAR